MANVVGEMEKAAAVLMVCLYVLILSYWFDVNI